MSKDDLNKLLKKIRKCPKQNEDKIHVHVLLYQQDITDIKLHEYYNYN